MKILMINSVCGIRSTGRICTDLATELEAQGHTVKIAYGRAEVPKKVQKYAVCIGTNLDVKLHGVRSRLLDGAGYGSRAVTQKFVDWVKEYNPDVIHLHNIHGYFLNIEILFKYLKTCGKKIIWTLHDCWAFTGHCTYFDYVKCDKWKTECYNCPQKTEYPASRFLDRSKRNFESKKELFSDIPNMQLVTPSQWLANLVKQSFLKDYPVCVIHNGVNTSVFKPIRCGLRKKYHLENKKIILGVAAVWDKRKGLDYLIRLAKDLPDQTVVIGLSEKQKAGLPGCMIGITELSDSSELAKWYGTADVFVNPTLEDNYPTTNLEAIACGTPVISFDTGGSGESAKINGKVVECGNYNQLKEAVIRLDVKKANEDISIERMVKDYIKIYEDGKWTNDK